MSLASFAVITLNSHGEAKTRNVFLDPKAKDVLNKSIGIYVTEQRVRQQLCSL